MDCLSLTRRCTYSACGKARSSRSSTSVSRSARTRRAGRSRSTAASLCCSCTSFRSSPWLPPTSSSSPPSLASHVTSSSKVFYGQCPIHCAPESSTFNYVNVALSVLNWLKSYTYHLASSAAVTVCCMECRKRTLTGYSACRTFWRGLWHGHPGLLVQVYARYTPRSSLAAC